MVFSGLMDSSLDLLESTTMASTDKLAQAVQDMLLPRGLRGRAGFGGTHRRRTGREYRGTRRKLSLLHGWQECFLAPANNFGAVAAAAKQMCMRLDWRVFFKFHDPGGGRGEGQVGIPPGFASIFVAKCRKILTPK